MPMSKLELYLTADMRYKASYLNKEGLIYHFKQVSTKNIYMIAREYCPRDNGGCPIETGCYECWESFVNKVLRRGGPTL